MLRLLIADDEKDARDKMIHCIDKFQNGFTIVGSASDGCETYEKIHSLSPDIVLIDIEMPGMTGIDVIRKIREDGLPVVFIIISSYNDFTYAQTALRLGVEDYLLKPFLPADVCSAVYKAAEHIQSIRVVPSRLLPDPQNSKSTFRMRMNSPLSYPFKQEKELIRAVCLPNEALEPPFREFISNVHANNQAESSILNCYVILYVELQRQSIQYDESSEIEAPPVSDEVARIPAFEQLLWHLCQKIHTRRSSGTAAGSVISSAVKYIDEHYASNLTLTEVANYVGVTPSYLSSQFNQILKIHFVDYIHKVRINQAKKILIEQPYYKGYEIAELVGYQSVKYFSQMFKKVTGITLNQYRGQAHLPDLSDVN